ncbi:MAG: hypothetical protein O2979_08425 [Proteobacteria bacterium]|nr:hypothetical protein [Pseudomonadota bacterium]
MRRWIFCLLVAAVPAHAADKSEDNLVDNPVERGLQKAGKAVERGAKAAGRAVDRGATAVQKGAAKVHKKIEEKITPK